MEPTLYAVIERLQKVEPKNSESLSAELSKIESEFDNEIAKSEKIGFNTGLFGFNWDLKQKHYEILASLLPKIEEVPEPEVSEPEITIVNSVVEEPVESFEVKVESSTIKPKASKAKIEKNTEP